MVKCPFCSFGNEDGALFCEQCKSDISNVAPAAAAPPFAPPTPIPESIPPGEMIPMAAMEEAPIMAAIVEDVAVAEIIPIAPADEPVQAEIIEAAVIEAAVIEAVPLEAEPVAETPAAAPVETPPAPPPAPEPVAETPPAPEPVPAPAPAPTPAPQMAAAAVSAPEPAAAPPKPTAPGNTPIPPGAAPKLVVQRGLKIGEEYGIFAGDNYIGRADDKPVDIDLTFQEPEERVWCSRQHALMVYDDSTGSLTIEDLNSSNGTFVNRERVYPGQPRQLYVGNTVQIGTVHMRVKV